MICHQCHYSMSMSSIGRIEDMEDNMASVMVTCPACGTPYFTIIESNDMIEDEEPIDDDITEDSDAC